MKSILFFLTMCAALFSCSSDDGTGDQPTKTAFRTVIVYMCGDNNLSDSLRQDYKEMIAGSAKLSDNVNVIVLNDNLRSTPFIAKLSGGQETIVRSWDTDFYVTTPDSMLNIMQWIMNKYPAEEYATIFTGHGTGSRQTVDTVGTSLRRFYAYGVDRNYSTTEGAWINVPTLATVFSNLKTPAGNRAHMKFIFFDCCCMQTVEDVYELRNYADYISSPLSEVPAAGASYREVIPKMSNDFDSYPEDLIFYTENQKLCASVIRTDKLNNLLQTTFNVLLEIKANSELSQKTELKYSGCIYYYRRTNPFLYDMQSIFHKQVEEELLSEATYNAWKQALNEVVICKKMASTWVTSIGIDFTSFNVSEETYGGLSMIVPRYGYDYSVSYSGDTERIVNEYMYDFLWCNKVGWKELGW